MAIQPQAVTEEQQRTLSFSTLEQISLSLLR